MAYELGPFGSGECARPVFLTMPAQWLMNWDGSLPPEYVRPEPLTMPAQWLMNWDIDIPCLTMPAQWPNNARPMAYELGLLSQRCPCRTPRSNNARPMAYELGRPDPIPRNPQNSLTMPAQWLMNWDRSSKYTTIADCGTNNARPMAQNWDPTSGKWLTMHARWHQSGDRRR